MSSLAHSQHGEAMAATTPEHFHSFPKLPAELRIMIWQMAIEPHPSVPKCGMQYFTIYVKYGEKSKDMFSKIAIPNLKPQCVDDLGYSDEPWTVYELAAPRVARANTGSEMGPSKYSWCNGNKSLYSINLGLRYACRESLDVLIESGGLKEPHRDGGRWLTKVRRTFFDSWWIKAWNGEQLMRLPQHSEDLYVFQLAEEHMWAAPDIDWAMCSTQSPMASVGWRWENVAFEFDPSWLKDLPEPFDIHLEASPRGLFARCVIDMVSYDKQPHGAGKVFLIDRTLRVTNTAGSIYLFTDRENTYIDVEENQVEHPRTRRANWVKNTSFYLIEMLWKRKQAMKDVRRVRQYDVLNILAIRPRGI